MWGFYCTACTPEVLVKDAASVTYLLLEGTNAPREASVANPSTPPVVSYEDVQVATLAQQSAVQVLILGEWCNAVFLGTQSAGLARVRYTTDGKWRHATVRPILLRKAVTAAGVSG